MIALCFLKSDFFVISYNFLTALVSRTPNSSHLSEHVWGRIQLVRKYTVRDDSVNGPTSTKLVQKKYKNFGKRQMEQQGLTLFVFVEGGGEPSSV